MVWLIAWVRVLAACAASLGSRRTATADSPQASTDRASGSVVRLIAWVRALAAWAQCPAASLGFRRAATADSPAAS